MRRHAARPSLSRLVLILVVLFCASWLSSVSSLSRGPSPSTSSLTADPEIIEPRLISRAEPIYPEAAHDADLEAKTILQLMIRKDGTVKVDDRSCFHCTVNRKSEPPEEVLHGWCEDFCTASLEAVSQWKYEPATKDGEPVEVYYATVIDYQLE